MWIILHMWHWNANRANPGRKITSVQGDEAHLIYFLVVHDLKWQQGIPE